MPVVTKKAGASVGNEDLKQRLRDEWQGKGTVDPRPDIIQEEDGGVVVHVYVVWSEWGDMDRQARSVVITDVYWELFKEKAIALTVAMGLTPEESKRMGIAV